MNELLLGPGESFNHEIDFMDCDVLLNSTGVDEDFQYSIKEDFVFRILLDRLEETNKSIHCDEVWIASDYFEKFQ